MLLTIFAVCKYQDQNPPPKHFKAVHNRPIFLFSKKLPLPGFLISSSRPSDGEKRRCGGSTEMLQWFLLWEPSFRSSSSIHLIIFFRFFFRQLFQEPVPLIIILIKISLKFDLFLFFRAFRLFKEINETLICDGCGASDPKYLPRRRMWARKNVGTVWF